MPASSNQINAANVQLFIYKPREYSVSSLKLTYLELNFDVLRVADDTVYAVGSVT